MRYKPRFNIGDRVILGAHEDLGVDNGGLNWVPAMDKFVGTIAIITHIDTIVLPKQGVCYRVDTNSFQWREMNMKPAYSNPNRKCSCCNTPAPHSDQENYMCAFCIASNSLDT